MSSHTTSKAEADSGVEIRASPIPNAGLGLFNLVHRKRNERIVRYEGHRSVKEMHPESTGDYCLEYAPGHFIDCQFSTTCCLGRFINDPRDCKRVNCKFVFDKKANEVWVVATKHIHPEQEIFITYGNKSYWK